MSLIREIFIIIISSLIGASTSAIITIFMDRSIRGDHRYDRFYSLKVYGISIILLVILLIVILVN